MTYSQQVQNQTQSYNNNLDSYFGSLADNYRTDVANAGRFGQDLQVIGGGLQTLSKKLDERRTELQNKAKVTFYNGYLEGIANGSIKEIPVDPLATPEDMADRIKAVTDQIRNGMPLEWGTNFLNVDDYQNRVVQKAMIDAKTANSVDEIKQLITDKGYDVSNSSNIAGSVAAARTEWISQNFMGFDEDLVLNGIPKLLDSSKKLTQAYQKENNMRNSVRIENELTVAAQTGSMTVSEIFAKAALTYTNKGVPRNAAEVNDFVNKVYKNIASQGRFVGKARENYVTHKPSWGGGKTLGELKEGFVAELDTDTSKAQKEQVGNFTRAREVAAAQWAQSDYQEYEDLVATGNRPNDNWVALKLQKFKEQPFGEADASLYLRMFTEEEVTSEEALIDINSKYGSNGLIYDDEPKLRHLTTNQKNQLGSRIQASAAKQAHLDYRRDAEDVFSGTVRTSDKLFGAKSGQYTDLGAHILRESLKDFDLEFAKGKRMGLDDEKAYERAIKLIRPEIGINGKYDTLDDPFVNDTSSRRFTEKMTRWFGMNPNRLPEPGEIEIPQQMIDYIEKWEKGFIPNAVELSNFSDRIPGWGMVDVAEAFKAAVGEPLDVPKEEESARFLGNVFPETRPLWKSPSPSGSDKLGTMLGAYEHLSFNSPELTHPALNNTLQDDFGQRIWTAIGLNEGTLYPDGTPTPEHEGHEDKLVPGRINRGVVSASEGTPEEVKAKWQPIINQIRRDYKNTIVDLGIPVGSKNYEIMIFNLCDLHVQAPLTKTDFIKQIPQILAAGVSAETLGRARHDAYIDPKTNELDTNFAVDPNNPRYSAELLQDQINRSMTIIDQARGSFNIKSLP